MLTIQRLEHQEPSVAARILQALELAHAQESVAIGSGQTHERTVEDIRTSQELHFGAYEGTELLGLVAVGPDVEDEQLAITLLFVSTKHQRRGVATSLISYVVEAGAGHPFSVTVAKMNTAAMSFYRSMGFIEYRHGVMGPEDMPVIKLRKNAP
jgi:ribosomal protein S18 acetylase RimI-like enzyme